MLSLVLLAACAPARPVVMWTTTRASREDRVEIRDNGDVIYTIIRNGVTERSESIRLTSEQVDELGDVLRSQRACELAHEPDYTPGADEAQTTLAITYPDLHCKVTLWHTEWQRGRARDISDTMRSMRTKPR